MDCSDAPSGLKDLYSVEIAPESSSGAISTESSRLDQTHALFPGQFYPKMNNTWVITSQILGHSWTSLKGRPISNVSMKWAGTLFRLHPSSTSPWPIPASSLSLLNVWSQTFPTPSTILYHPHVSFPGNPTCNKWKEFKCKCLAKRYPDNIYGRNLQMSVWCFQVYKLHLIRILNPLCELGILLSSFYR